MSSLSIFDAEPDGTKYRPQEQKKASITMEFAMPRNRALIPSSLVTFYLAVTGIAYLLVVMSSGFILRVNLSDWTRGRSLMPNNKILSSFVLSNLCFSTASIVDYFFSFIWEEFYGMFYYVQQVLFTLDISTSFTSFWFCAWLSVFHCMKIVDFKQPLLLKMKLKFSGLVHWLLLGSVLVSLGAAALFQWAVMLSAHRDRGAVSTNQTASVSPASNCTHNSVSEKTMIIHMCPVYRVLIIILGCSMPLMVVVFCSVQVLYSLFRHTHKMEQNLSPSHLEAHVKAAKAVLSLLLCYVFMFVCQTLIRTEIYRNWYYQHFLCLAGQLATILAQNTTLIQSNPKMKQRATQLLSCLPGPCRKGNSRRPTELEEV